MADRFDDIDWNRQFRIGVWVAQGILAVFCLTIGGPMLATPAALPEGMGLGFAADLPELAVRTLGLVYLVLGVGLAGAVFTSVVAHAGPHGGPPAFFRAVDAGFLAAACAAGVGVVTSAVRGS